MIKASSSSVGMAMQLGFAILYGSTFLYLGTPSTFTCAAQPFFLTIGISSVIGLLLAKTWRIYRLFSSVVQTRKSVIGYIVNAIVTGSISINIILCAIWMGVDPPVPTRQYISEGVTNYVCSSPRSSTFIGLLVAYNVILVLLGSTLGFLTRGVEERFNESRQIGFAMYNLLALAAIGVPILLASSWLMQLFYCVLSAVILIGGVATQSILFIPKIMSALGKSDDDEHGGGGLQNLGGFAGKMGTGSSGKKRPMSGNYGARTTTNSTQVTHADWETLVLYTAVRVVEGRLSSFSAMWASSAVMYFRDAKTRRPMLGVLSTANETGVGQFFDLTMVASTDAMKGNPGSSSVGTTTESSAASTGTAGTGGSTPNDAPPSMTAATRVIKVEMESGLKLFIKVPNGALFDLWSTVLGAGGGSQKSSGVASTSNALGATKTATTTAGGTLPKLSANKLSNN
ncbi:7 transmembrane sweet-taste receptor of 3 GCPR-domain-containing protein [Blastocladiella britannica]|nr:7 transmembrane sweet-taste receptor of 3 GCPR-domain-containing protein [Blastocladiella britannica]